MGFQSSDFDPWPMPWTPLARPWGMDSEDPVAKVRAALISDLLPKVRRLNPHWSDDEVLEMAESMAELRLLDEELGSLVGPGNDALPTPVRRPGLSSAAAIRGDQSANRSDQGRDSRETAGQG